MSRKRKHTQRRGSPDYNAGGSTEMSSFPQSPISTPLFIQAHEATIIRSRPDLVQALTAHDPGDGKGKGSLIQWHGEELPDEKEVWVDRYDARLLLPTVPCSSGLLSTASLSSPTGWSDLPSDSEDTFFFSPKEIEDLQREKRRRLIDSGREARLRAMRETDPDPARDFMETKELWGGDDEEASRAVDLSNQIKYPLIILMQPDDAQRTLMERTAKHLLTSPNSGQLEMRILANHGSDQRFAFLRGRWRNAWQIVKLLAKQEKDRTESEAVEVITGGGLVAYGDSDDSDAGAEDQAQGTQVQSEPVPTEAVKAKEAGEIEKEARRARAREWIRQRKANKLP